MSRVIQNSTLASLFLCQTQFVEPDIFPATVYRDATIDDDKNYYGGNRANLVDWHSDISFELQPAGTTFFFILEQVIIPQICLLGYLIHPP